MPAGLSCAAQSEIESRLEELCGDGKLSAAATPGFSRWIAAAGIAAALVCGFALFPRDGAVPQSVKIPDNIAEEPEFVVLNESDRVEEVRDEGLFVDSGGSAVRKVRVRFIGERRVRDEETGIVVTLLEPREEMFLLPVSTF
ncbi:hypothetical protein HZ994_15995 [Akkermansiaceae bacterium]|nr:hypothetical protein HZ994_15995 [Akkermansiaceae bacterium]